MPLVLSRRVRESLKLIVQGREIVIGVSAIGGGQVKLGIEAPEDVVVLRDEIVPKVRESLLERLQKAYRAADWNYLYADDPKARREGEQSVADYRRVYDECVRSGFKAEADALAAKLARGWL